VAPATTIEDCVLLPVERCTLAYIQAENPRLISSAIVTFDCIYVYVSRLLWLLAKSGVFLLHFLQLGLLFLQLCIGLIHQVLWRLAGVAAVA